MANEFYVKLIVDGKVLTSFELEQMLFWALKRKYPQNDFNQWWLNDVTVSPISFYDENKLLERHKNKLLERHKNKI